jgi:hypothetical protein
MGNHGYTVPIDQEYMIIFGGITARDIRFTDSSGVSHDIYNNCEQFSDLTGEELPKDMATCGEELLNDVWIYNVLNGTWTFMKPGTNKDYYMWPWQPSARYGHTGSYVEIVDTSVVRNSVVIPVLRKYLYIYGGFAFNC